MPERRPLLIIGAGAVAANYAEAFAGHPDYAICGFVEDAADPASPRTLEGLPVYSTEVALGMRETHSVICCIGSPGRRALIERFESRGFDFATLISPLALIHPKAVIEPGCIVSDHTDIDPLTFIGRHSILSAKVSFSHHSSLGPFGFVGPGTIVAGSCTIGAGCFIGMAAVIRDHITIGDGATIGAGAVVVKNVEPGTTVAGNPARPLRSKATNAPDKSPSRKPLLLLGAGDMATTYATQFQDDPQYDIVGFVENTPSPPGRSARSLPVYDIEDALALRETHGVLCAIGSPGRESLIQRFEDAGFEFATLVSPSAIVHDSESIESGCVISDLANIDPCVRIGRHTLVTSRVTVAHHTTIGPCSFLAPGATIGGHCKIGTRCFIGMGAIILDHITIGHDVTVGAGAVVTKDVPPGQTVVGIPARPLSKKDSAPIPLRHVRRPILILGAGGMARAIATNFRDNPLFEIAGFVQNSDPSAVKETAVGLPVYWVDDVMDLREKYAVISVIGSREKRLLVQAFESAGFEFINLIAPTALVDRTAGLGVGCVVTHWASIETETSAGNHSFFGRHTLLAHHTHIGAFSMVAPGSLIAGESRIGSGCFVGMGAVLKDHLTIGDDVTIGAGSVVVKDVPSGTTVAGNPARILKPRD